MAQNKQEKGNSPQEEKIKGLNMDDLSYGSTSNDVHSIDLLPSPRNSSLRMKWYINMFLINFVEFSSESTRGITLPTLYIYCTSIGGDLMYMGLLTSAFSIGRLISSMYLGWLCDRCSFKTVYMVSTVVCLIGNILYIFPNSKVAGSKQILVVSRFLVGFGAGNRSVCRANVAMVTSVSQRLKYITILSAVVFLGYALTPGLGSFTTNADFYLLGVHINHFTAPGLILVVINSLTIVALLFVFDERAGKDDAPPDSVVYDTSADINVGGISLVSTRIIQIGVWVFIWLNFTARGVLSVFETINVPLFLQATGEDPNTREAVLHSSNYQFYLGCFGLITYACITGLRHKITDVTWLIIGFSTMAAGNIILSFYPSQTSFFRLTVAELLVWSIGCPITAAVIVAAFSKILGGKPQGTYMGILGSAGSISRVILPLLPSALPSFAELFGINAFLCITCVVAIILYSRCVADAKSRNNAMNAAKVVGSPLLQK